MPAPAEFAPGDGRCPITTTFSVALEGHRDARLEDGLARALRLCEARTGFTLPRPFGEAGAEATLRIVCDGPGNAIPVLGEDESYELTVTPQGATLRAPAVVGVLRGLETMLQLLAGDGNGWYLPAVHVRDAPRFPWRGLLVDVCRHWQPMPVIKRTLDGMALAKLNVLHLHLTEDQGFRVESRRYPRLHELGSDGDYFTQDEIREIIAYAAARGIRVVPEFDLPGHATSWLVSHPELGSQPGPYSLARTWGIFDATLDPTNEQTYELLDGFLGEMAALFPDPFVHIGGDENNGKHWNANPRIQAFIREHGLQDNHGLQAYFNRRLLAILQKHGKQMIGWDEIVHPDLPRDAIVQSWRGRESLAATARQGFRGILSNGYYIDLCHPARDHYRNDPLPPDTTLTPEEQARVLGGEATMWGEWVTPETIDSRIWPRTVAIAERLWSPRELRDVGDMYRRLAIVSTRLEERGLSLTRHVDFMVRRLAGDAASDDEVARLRLVADLVEPVKGYNRGRQQPDTTQFTPLTGLVDCARPDSIHARRFAELVDRAIFAGDTDDLKTAEHWLHEWSHDAESLMKPPSTHHPRIARLQPLFSRLATAASIGAEACAIITGERGVDDAWRDTQFAALAEAAQPYDACELPFVPTLRLLVAAASVQAERATLAPARWRERVEALAAAAP